MLIMKLNTINDLLIIIAVRLSRHFSRGKDLDLAIGKRRPTTRQLLTQLFYPRKI